MFVSKARSHAFHVACCCSVSYVWPYVQRVGVLVQRTSTDVHNWITFSVNPLVLAQSKTAHYILWLVIPYGWTRTAPSCFRGLADRILREFCAWHQSCDIFTPHDHISAPEEIQQACNKSRNYTIENTEYVNTRVLIGNTFAALQPREGSFQ